LEFLLFYQLLYQTYRSSLYESNFLNPFIAYLPCFAFMQRPLYINRRFFTISYYNSKKCCEFRHLSCKIS
ncbi:hypothetical protein, partial [Candidatus Bandiella numerosa]|uniref:hypothetical protein n=1 Tax=Candidatus Bandiella numerosa TaxID=2570586 RepID=UPI001F2C72F4